MGRMVKCLFLLLFWVYSPFVIAAAPAASQESFAPADAHYLAPGLSTAGAAIAAGSDGSLHMAAATYNHGGDGGVIYARCRADCAAAANWTQVTIPAGNVVRTEIAVTPAGAPRLLITAVSADHSGGRDFLYAECGPRSARLFAPDCTDAGAWTVGRIASKNDSSMGDYFELLLPTRSFALDPAGSPRFIYTDANYAVEPDRYGAYFMSCDSACTEAGNWAETDLAIHIGTMHEQFTRPVLAIGPSGSAHVLASVYAFDTDGTALPNDLYYYECAANCAVRGNWQRTSVINPGSGSYPSPGWDLTVDGSGRPRAAVFIGGAATDPELDYSLIYVWCDRDCTEDDFWSGQVIETDGFGEAPALALDTSGRPQIAFLSSGAEPALASCTADCETTNAAWTSRYLEGEIEMATDRPTALPFTCDGELWNAMMPDLAVGPDATSFVVYDVTVQARCLYQAFMDPQITYEFHEIWRGARLALPPPF